MPKLDLDSIEQIDRIGYPMPYAAQMKGRLYRRIAPAAVSPTSASVMSS